MKRLRPTRFPRRKATRKALLKIYEALYRHYGPRHWWPADTPFEVMVGAILTQNTAWKNVEKAILNLKKAQLLSPRALYKVPVSDLARLIRPAGYFNLKARRLGNFMRFLHERSYGHVQKMLEAPLARLRKELLEVNGIGKETADSILLYAAGKPIFVVDAYTKRVLTRHRFLRGDEGYDQIQALFLDLLPRKASLFNDYHAQIVEVGKDYCRKSPRCEICPLKKYL